MKCSDYLAKNIYVCQIFAVAVWKKFITITITIILTTILILAIIIIIILIIIITIILILAIGRSGTLSIKIMSPIDRPRQPLQYSTMLSQHRRPHHHFHKCHHRCRATCFYHF